MSSTGLSYLGPIQVTGKEVRGNHYVLHLTVLPGADSSYRQESEGQSLRPPLDCPTSTDQKVVSSKLQAAFKNTKSKCTV